MKKYIDIYLKSFFFMSLLFLFLSIIVYQRTDVRPPFALVSYGIFIVSIFLSTSIWLFKLEEGNGLIHAIIGYLVLIPAILVIRNVYGTALFRFSYLIYIIFIFIGIIYGIVFAVVSKKYKNEVDKLNEMIDKNKN
ncbi:MAG: hypothetical protein K8Q99_02715 [Acholeplasmataceae bacterium]|nr:hypothetical protein [Acholeplasmataceae bacterium]